MTGTHTALRRTLRMRREGSGASAAFEDSLLGHLVVRVFRAVEEGTAINTLGAELFAKYACVLP